MAALLLAPLAAAQQGTPQQQLDDPNANNSPDGFDIHLESDGDLWVACWADARDPVNTFDDDVFVAVSQDAGKTWGSEIQVTTGAASAVDIDDPYMVVDNGTIYVTYDDDNGGTNAMLEYSTDLGVTWTTLTLSSNGNNPIVAAEGSNVAVIWYDNTFPNEVKALTSNTGAAGLAPGTEVTISNVGADVDADGYDMQMLGGVAHVAFVDDLNGNPGDDVFYTSADVLNAGSWSAPVQINQGLIDVETDVLIEVDGSVAHFAYYADDVPGSGSNFDDIVHYNNYDFGTATLGTEQMLMGLNLEDSDYFGMDAQGQNVVVTWSDDSTGDDEPYVAVSNDGGATFTETDLDVLDQSGLSGPLDVQQLACWVDGEMMYVLGEDDSLNSNSIDELPAFWYSNDSGATWYGAFLLGQDFEADEDIDTERWAWHCVSDRIAGIWQSDGGAALGNGIWFSDIAFPYVEATYNAGSGTMDFTMVGNPVSEAGTFSRWAASTTLGSQVHPENPGLTVDLGPSGLYNMTTSYPPIPLITDTVQADGSSSMTLNVGSVSGITAHLQGWTNSGSATGGTSAGSIFELVIP